MRPKPLSRLFYILDTLMHGSENRGTPHFVSPAGLARIKALVNELDIKLRERQGFPGHLREI
jgi:hypothetical protein